MKLEDFESRITKPSADSCWEWQGSTNTGGYGTVAIDGKTFLAHRVAAYLAGLVDSIPAPKRTTEKGFVLHRCDNRICCNPSHFRIGNYTENQLDCYAKGRANKKKGSAHANAKLTAEQVEDIRNKYSAGGVRQVDLAAEYGVSQRVISLVVRKETYL